MRLGCKATGPPDTVGLRFGLPLGGARTLPHTGTAVHVVLLRSDLTDASSLHLLPSPEIHLLCLVEIDNGTELHVWRAVLRWRWRRAAYQEAFKRSMQTWKWCIGCTWPALKPTSKAMDNVNVDETMPVPAGKAVHSYLIQYGLSRLGRLLGSRFHHSVVEVLQCQARRYSSVAR